MTVVDNKSEILWILEGDFFSDRWFLFASLSEIKIVNSINLSSKLEYGGNIDH